MRHIAYTFLLFLFFAVLDAVPPVVGADAGMRLASSSLGAVVYLQPKMDAVRVAVR